MTVMIALAESLCNLGFDYYYYQHYANVKDGQGEAKEGQRRLEGGWNMRGMDP